MTISPLEPSIRGKILSSRVYPEFFKLPSGARVLNVGCGNAPQAVAYRGHYTTMVGVDIQLKRLKTALQTCEKSDISSFYPVQSNVERLPFKDAAFDAALAIDILEHVQQPRSLISELARVLKPDGRLLITYPAMHDHFRDGISFLARNCMRLRPPKPARPACAEWDPDEHQEHGGSGSWEDLLSERFCVVARRATTMFPPLHLYGIPRFWFAWGWLHAFDAAICAIPGIRNLGQSMMCSCRIK